MNQVINNPLPLVESFSTGIGTLYPTDKIVEDSRVYLPSPVLGFENAPWSLAWYEQVPLALLSTTATYPSRLFKTHSDQLTKAIVDELSERYGKVKVLTPAALYHPLDNSKVNKILIPEREEDEYLSVAFGTINLKRSIGGFLLWFLSETFDTKHPNAR